MFDFVKPLIGALALGLAGAASATTIDIEYTGTTGAYTSTSQSDSVAGAMSYLTSTGSSFTAFCVELSQSYATTDSGYQTYTVSSFTGTEYTLLQGLFSSSYSSVSTATELAAFQLAVWEITHETSGTLNILSGTYGYTGEDASFAALVNSYLTAASSYTGDSLYTLTKLTSATYQDLITVSSVPEPSTYALMLAGLGAMGLIARRRRRD